ncbi:MAG: hypothetical protein ACR2O3_14810 [Rhizobiaceae bacterium]
MNLTTENMEKLQSNSAQESVTRLVPTDILGLLGDPPLVRGEEPEDYDRLFNQLAATIDPQDFVEWIFNQRYFGSRLGDQALAGYQIRLL